MPPKHSSKDSKAATRQNTQNMNTNQHDQVITSKEELSNLFDEKLKPIQEQLSTINNSVQYALEEIKKIDILEQEVAILKTTVSSCQSDNDTLKQEVKDLKNIIIKQEIYSRKLNVKLLNVKEDDGEDTKTVVMNLLMKAGIIPHRIGVVNVHRIGQKMKKKKRPILLKLQNLTDKELIFEKKDHLKSAENVLVVNDYPSEVVERRKTLVPIFIEAKENHENLKAKLIVDSLVLNGKTYTVDNIDTVPVPELHPSRVFTKTRSGTTIYFTKHSKLSNFYMCDFELEGRKFKSVEQYFTYKKATTFNDLELADDIMKESNPRKNKQQGYFVKNFKSKKWSMVCEDIMFDGMLAKFSQNPDLKQELLDTGNTVIAESSPTDLFWGTGLSLLDEDAFTSTAWPGDNKAGQLLERIRQTVK